MDNINIIGGSLAGLTTALNIKRMNEDLDVTIFEDHKEIGLPVKCAEGYIDHFGIGKPPDDCIDMEIKEVRFKFNFEKRPDKIFSVPFPNVFFVMDRTKYEKRLADQCMKLGVNIKTGHRT